MRSENAQLTAIFKPSSYKATTHFNMPSKEERIRSIRIKRYEEASKKGVLTKDAKSCIYKYTCFYRPIIMSLKFVMVHLAHKMYKSLQYLLIWREHGPRGDVSFMHTCYREVNMDKYARRNPGKAVPRIGEITFLSRSRFEQSVEMLERSPNVSTKQWLLAVSPFSPIQITTVMWEPSKLLELKKTAHGTDGRIQVKNSIFLSESGLSQRNQLKQAGSSQFITQKLTKKI